jgi:uncharacterized protein
MIIDLSSVSTAPRRFPMTLESDWWRGDAEYDQVLALNRPLKVTTTIYRAGSKYVLEGHLSGGLTIRCDRCLEPYDIELESDFRVFLAPDVPHAGQNEVELNEEELAFDFIVGNEVELEGIIREQVFLSIPMKCVCREDCAGLCVQCGADLNRQACKCKARSGHPGFAQLKKLKLETR